MHTVSNKDIDELNSKYNKILGSLVINGLFCFASFLSILIVNVVPIISKAAKDDPNLNFGPYNDGLYVGKTEAENNDKDFYINLASFITFTISTMFFIKSRVYLDKFYRKLDIVRSSVRNELVTINAAIENTQNQEELVKLQDQRTKIDERFDRIIMITR